MNDLCSIELLKSALAGDLSNDDEANLTRHIEQCESCSTVMEELAADKSFSQSGRATRVGCSR